MDFPRRFLLVKNDVYYYAMKRNPTDGKITFAFYKLGEDKPKFDPIVQLYAEGKLW